MKRHNLLWLVPATLLSVILIAINITGHEKINSNVSQLSERIDNGDKYPKGLISSTNVEANSHVDTNFEDSNNIENSLTSNNQNVAISYLATPQIGYIGFSENTASDSPADNIFEFHISQIDKSKNRVWLTYELNGLSDAVSVNKTINDRLAYGGYIDTKNEDWKTIKEEISPEWLVIGKNTVMFSKNMNGTNYSVRNVCIVVENSLLEDVVVTALAKTSNGTYLHGFTNDNIKRISVNGDLLSIVSNEFETILPEPKDEITLTIVSDDNSSISKRLSSKEILSDALYPLNRNNKFADKNLVVGCSNSISLASTSLSVDSVGLIKDLNVSITSLRDNDIPPLNYGMSNVTAEDAGYRFLPHGTHFENDGASISLKYDRTKIPAGYTEDDIRTFYFDTDKKQWIALDRIEVDTKNLCVVSKTTHFTDMINGVIQAPESPETEGFTPTMMNDIKIADPAAGITLIAPPTANNRGSANLQYPIETPPARNGMSPNLVVSYNSDVSDGWLGEGWDIQIPSITVDTRWGVPRYDSQYETETYLLNGEMLCTPNEAGEMTVAHRGELINRGNSDRQFYTRLGGDFSKIIRKGDSPSNYYWEVTDKNGTIYTYGEQSNGGAVIGCLQDTATKVISEWKLTSVKEVHDDFIKYYYTQDTETAIGGISTIAVYLESIEMGYGFNNENTQINTTIDFISVQNKSTKRSNARSGFLTSSQKLLNNIIVRFKNDKFRHYKFKYKSGVFSKELLDSISSYAFDSDEDSTLIAHHAMNYHDDVNQNNGLTLINQPIQYNETSQNLEVPLDESLNSNDIKVSLLGSNINSFAGGSFYAGIGLFDGSYTKSATGGVSVGFSESNSVGQSALIDIDGDGLLDKVYKQGGNVYYRKQLTSDSEALFDSPIQINGLNNISQSSTTSFSIGAKLNVGWGPVVTTAGGDYTNSTTTTTGYFSDVNGDGLIDYISDGQTLFNYLVDGVPTFSVNSSLSSNPIDYSGSVGIIDNKELTDSIESRKNLMLETSPMIDAVKVWEAPKSGKIVVEGLVRLVESETTAPEADGVKVSIESCNFVHWSDTINPNDFANKLHQCQINIIRGEKVLFRVQSGITENSNSINDIVEWSPKITYLQTTLVQPNEEGVATETSETNETEEASIPVIYPPLSFDLTPNGDYVNIFEMPESNVYSSDSYIRLHNYTDVKFTLKGTINKPITTDTVILKILGLPDEENSIGDNEYVLWEDSIYPKTELQSVALDTVILNPLSLKNLKFEISSPSNVRWQDIKWNPQIHYNNGNNNEIQYASVKYITYSKQLHTGTFATIINTPLSNIISPIDPIIPVIPGINETNNTIIGGGTTQAELNKNYVYVKPSLDIIDDYTGKIMMTVKSLNTLYGSKEYNVTNSVIQDSDNYVSFPLPSLLNRLDTIQVWCEFFCDTTIRINSAKCDIYVAKKDSILPDNLIIKDVNANVYGKLNNNEFGTLYRGWGAFAYNAGEGRFEQPINITENSYTKYSNEYNEKNNDSDTTNDINLDYRSIPYFSLNIDPEFSNKWIGPNENFFITENRLRSCRLFKQNVNSINPLELSSYNSSSTSNIKSAPGYPIITSNSSGNGLASFTPFSISSASANGTIELSTMDMNGDGYHDIITKNNVQYSTNLGALSELMTPFNAPVQTSEASSVSYGSGGYPVPAFSFPSSGGLSSVNSMAVSESNSKTYNLNISGDYGKSINTDVTTSSFIDINGDGLPDILSQTKDSNTKYIKLNLGYRFTDPINFDYGIINDAHSSSSNIGLGLGFDFAAGTLTGGVGAVKTSTINLTSFIDINGDGLVDKITATDDNTLVWLNRGNMFDSQPIVWSESNRLNYSESTSTSINTAVSVYIPLPLLFTKIIITPSFSIGSGFNTSQFDIRDMDGDGFVDILASSSEESLSIWKSTIARTNKLKTITNSLGGKFHIDYEHNTPTINHPGGKWVMSSVVIDDGISDDGANPRMDFEYGNGVYDRREREFLGFGTVTTSEIDTDSTNSVYRKTIQQYDVSNYYVKGNLLSSEIKDAGGNLFSKESHEYYSYSARATNNDYTIFETSPTVGVISYTPLRYTKQEMYEGGNSGVIMSESWYGYKIGNGSFGELITYKYSDKGNLGNNGSGTYDYQTTIEYFDTVNDDKYIWGLPKTVIVKGNNNSVFRSSSATYNDIGELTQYTQQLDNGSAVTNYTYDNYGNLSQTIYPTDENGDRLTFEYSYEDTMGMYIETVTNINENFKSNIDGYDFRYGIPLSKTDINNQTMTYTVDNLGRILTILSPMNASTSSGFGDSGADYTIKFEYFPAVLDAVTYEIISPAYAITRHYDERRSLTTDKDIETVAFCDGFGRIIQTKKEAMVYNGNASSVRSMIVSGKNIYDSYGRVVKTYYPTSETFSDTAKTQYVTEKDLLPPTEMSYDVLDRTILVKTPIGTETMSEYYLNGNDIVSKVTDAEGNIVEAYANGSGNTVKTVQYHNNNPINTLFEYDGIGQLISTTDNEGNKTTSVYDMAGRRTQVSHPASGVTSFTYDALGNILTKQTANMGSTEFIKYKYEFNKLMSIEYPLRPQNNVHYAYGNSNANDGSCGRVTYVEDGSGSAKYSYDELGNVISETRTVIVPNNGIYTFNTQWNYDSFNRLLDMTYPGSNNETVYYNYDLGGNLVSVTHNISDVNKQYVDSIFYDKFGSRVYMKYGNGAVTTYAYDSLRRMSNLNVVRANQTIINNNYEYDAVNNITSIVNNRSTITNKLGAEMSHNYEYDDLYRLISAQGNYNNGTANYELAMGYDDMHRITSKRQTLSRNDMQFDGTLNVGYNLAYTYSDKKKFQLESIQDYNYRTEGTPNDSILNRHIYKYDANGNMVLDSIGRVMKDGHLEENISKRQLLWDDENRLLAINDNGYVSSYLYNANGDRTVKLSGNNEAVYVNTIPSANETQTDRFTIYPSPYMVFANGGRYTKHIYIGSERIASKVAIDNGYDPRTTQTAAYGNNKYAERLNDKSTALNDSIEAIYTKFQLPFNGLNNDDIIQGFQPSLMSLASTASSTDNYEEYSYYIHSDHLGSTSYVTDANGAVSQHVEYVPFGEVFIEELSSSAKLNTPFLFNGKELDEETGLYYYGARYYDPQLSLWLSVDPLSNYDPLNNENYLDGEHNSGVYNPFNNSVYSYCYNNPVKLYEPNGKQAVAIHGTWSSNDTWEDQAGIDAFTKKKFGHTEHDYRFKWSGGNSAKDRTVGALKLISHIRKTRKEHSLTSSEAITLVGHSHGGNVAIEAANLMVNMEEFNDIKINLLTINTPVRDDYQLSSSALKRVTHINVYDPKDPVQIIGGNIYSKIPRGEPTLLDFFGEYGPAGRIFKNAMNIQVNNPQGLFRDFHNSHNRTQDWINK